MSEKIIYWVIVVFIAIILLKFVAKLAISLLPFIALGVVIWFFWEPIKDFLETIKNEKL